MKIHKEIHMFFPLIIEEFKGNMNNSLSKLEKSSLICCVITKKSFSAHTHIKGFSLLRIKYAEHLTISPGNQAVTLSGFGKKRCSYLQTVIEQDGKANLCKWCF